MNSLSNNLDTTFLHYDIICEHIKKTVIGGNTLLDLVDDDHWCTQVRRERERTNCPGSNSKPRDWKSSALSYNSRTKAVLSLFLFGT